MGLLWPVTLLMVAAGLASARQTDYCFANDSYPYLQFASKTAYTFIDKPSATEDIPHCQAVQIWILSRHGTRYPGLKTIRLMKNLTVLRDQIIRNHEMGSRDGRLCNADLKNLQEWNLTVTEDDENKLTWQGKEDLQFIARRFKSKFSTLLNTPYKSSKYMFRFTNTERTEESAKSFADGLFGSSSGIYFPDPLENDTLLQSYSSCEEWKETVDDNPDAIVETTQFRDGPIMDALILNVSARLGFRHKLKFNDIYTMYDMCRFDKAWKVHDPSPWCAVFSKPELKVLEYLEDTKYYYKSGYGHKINVNLGCPPVKDLLDHFSKLEDAASDHPVGIFYFSHSSMLHMVQARLGVYNDSQPLLHDNYYQMQNRQWKVSKIGPFATNIAAVFLKCTEGEKYQVLFYGSESPLEIEGCQVGLCSWKFVKEKFSKVVQECDLSFCKTDVNGSDKLMATLTLITLLMILCIFH